MKEVGRLEPRHPRVLVVEPDDRIRDELGRWLEEDGYEVLECPGPTFPNYVCPGGRGERCPLAVAADVVVLDLEQESDVMAQGTPGFDLLLYYGGMGKPMILLSGPGDPVRPRPEPHVAVILRFPGKEQLLGAARTVVG